MKAPWASLRSAFDENQTPMFVHSRSTGDIVDVNRAACAFYGYARDAFLRLQPFDLYPLEMRAEIQEYFDAEGAEARTFGSRHVQFSFRRILWEGAEADLVAIQDMAAVNAVRKEEQSRAHALATSEARYQALFEDNLTPLFVCDRSTRLFIDVNSAACKYYGYSREEFLRRGPRDFYRRERHEEIEPQLSKTSAEEAADFDTTHLKADGSSTDVHVTLVTIPWKDGPAALAMVQDVSERNAAVAKIALQAQGLTQSEARYRKVFDENLLPMAIYDKSSGRFIDVNRAAIEYYGYNRQAFLRLRLIDFHPPEVQERVQLQIDNLRPTAEFNTAHLKADGSSTDVHVTFMPIPWNDIPASLIMVQDISERKAALAKIESSNETFRRAQRIGRFGDWSVDLRSGERYWSDELFRLLGIAKEVGIPQTQPPHRNFFSEDDLELMARMERAALADGQTHGADHLALRPDGTTCWVHQELIAELDEMGNAVRVRGTLHDISDRKDTEARLEAQARIDPLTGLPNRKAATEALNACIAGAARRGTAAAILFIDVDNFKNINDTLGHTAGDEFLKVIATRLRDSLRMEDFVGRMGGDEFIVILSDTADPASLAIVAENILALAAKPVNLDHAVTGSVSIGIALFPQDGPDAETLIMNADTAMYHSKREGRSTHRFFSAEMHAAAEKRLLLDTELRGAIEKQQIAVWYQPIVSADGELVATEALARWPQADGSILAPAAFVPHAEDSGLIVPLGNWILRTACKRNAQWNAATGASLRINVNVSAKQIAGADFVSTVLDALAASGLAPELLELELTETAIAFSPEESAHIVRELRAAGVRVALDDFGTGYNSLVNLRHLEIDTLKLEKCFVDDIAVNAVDQAIASAVISAARSLGATAVAEGVETQAQLLVLQHLGFDEMQGYIFAKPMSGEAFERLLSDIHCNGSKFPSLAA